MTNYDKIKNMSIDDTAEFFTKFGDYCGNQCTYEPARCLDGTCKKRIKQWLQQEAKPTLSEAESVILENVNKDYKWIARECDGELWIYASKPVLLKDEKAWWNTSNNKSAASLYLFNHLFDFIKYEDEKTYNIENLLKGEI